MEIEKNDASVAKANIGYDILDQEQTSQRDIASLGYK